MNFCYNSLEKWGCTGRLRVAREGFNGLLTSPEPEGIRKFTEELKAWQPEFFAHIDYKFVDNNPDNHLLRELKVFPVTEIVTYGFSAFDAPVTNGGNHLKPEEFHKAMSDPNSVMIDVRNYNESLIGKFNPPAGKLLDPCMRKSTEFP